MRIAILIACLAAGVATGGPEGPRPPESITPSGGGEALASPDTQSGGREASASPHAQSGGREALASPHRIVSVVPALTETLFAIGAASRIVGVSSFDTVPPDMTSITRVGGLVDPDVERILSLKPDLVITYESQANFREQLARARIPMFVYRHGGLADVVDTTRELGRRVGFQAAAENVARRIEQKLAAVRARVRGRARPRTMLVFGRQPLSLRGIYASGGYGFLHDMLEAAGGTNVFGDVKRESIQVTTEVILARAPDVIIELKYGNEAAGHDLERERASWDALASVPAVRQRRVILLVGDEFVVPGPRVADATERMALALHPHP